jgi:hypothetical protein
MDGDGQMDPEVMIKFIKYFKDNSADFVKGNRFYHLKYIKKMPIIRLIGNGALSFLVKASSGYWKVMDPTNGYFAISRNIFGELSKEKLEKRYFFESDLLFRLHLARARLKEVPIPSRYENENSSLSIMNCLFSFPPKLLMRFFKRIVYEYFLRDFNSASLQIVLGLILVIVGGDLGFYYWNSNELLGIYSPPGQVMLTALPLILGVQFLIAAWMFDIQDDPQ